ncbi:hypothetical protein [Hymenobacter jeollabukensis]|uniref:Uncharacterized protein n=1 Tax=Hymenobacter jeollabukensis TaxID=2025313 RepID=A0A5R8WR44_9BACT|nr:hypothetical protein [Hymenobacter jeollabukensis]TLM92482.1 hypothetical protein FDY95_13760 [Hymenobacter jeollabukensis]
MEEQLQARAGSSNLQSLTVAEARMWYDKPSDPAYPRMPLDLRWESAQVLSDEERDYVVVPIVESLMVFDGDYQGYRRLVISKQADGEPTGRIVELVLKEQVRPASEVDTLARDVYRRHIDGGWYTDTSLNGLVAFYNKDNLFISGKGYVDGVATEDAWLNFTLESETPYGESQRLSCFKMVIHMTTSATDVMVIPVCYVYGGSENPGGYGGVGSNPGGQNPGGYPSGGAGSGSGGTPVNSGGGGFGGNASVTQIIVDPTILNDPKANCIYNKIANNNNFNLLLNNFRNTTNYNVRFALGNVSPFTGTTRWNYNTRTAEVTIDASALSYQHAIWGAVTFFHEAFHANLQQHAISTFSNFELTTWPKPINDMTLQELVASVDASAAKDQAWSTATHNFMANHIQIMADGLREFVQNNYPQTYAQIGNNPEAYKALAFMGLEGSREWTAMSAVDQQRYRNFMNDFVTVERHDCL